MSYTKGAREKLNQQEWSYEMSGRPKHIKLKVDEFTGQSDLPTEQEINEWTQKTRNKDICGIVSCFNKPTTKCNKCTNYYCLAHFPRTVTYYQTAALSMILVPMRV